MPTTRPVLQTSSSALASRGNDPGLKQLRSSLVGARVDLLKTTAFAAVLISLLGLVVHHNRLASGDNQFAANAGAALTALEGTVSAQSDGLVTSARARTDVIAAAAQAKMNSTAAQVASALKSTAKPAPAPAVKVASSTPVARPVRHTVVAAPEAHLLKVAMHPHHAVAHVAMHPVKLTAVPRATTGPAAASLTGNLMLDAVDKASDVLGAETSRAYYSFLDFVQGGTDMLSFPSMRTHAQSWVDVTISQFTSGSMGSSDPAAFISNCFNVNSAVTAAAAISFLVVCMAMFAQIRNGLRGVGGRRAGA